MFNLASCYGCIALRDFSSLSTSGELRKVAQIDRGAERDYREAPFHKRPLCLPALAPALVKHAVLHHTGCSMVI